MELVTSSDGQYLPAPECAWTEEISSSTAGAEKNRGEEEGECVY